MLLGLGAANGDTLCACPLHKIGGFESRNATLQVADAALGCAETVALLINP